MSLKLKQSCSFVRRYVELPKEKHPSFSNPTLHVSGGERRGDVFSGDLDTEAIVYLFGFGIIFPESAKAIGKSHQGGDVISNVNSFVCSGRLGLELRNNVSLTVKKLLY